MVFLAAGGGQEDGEDGGGERIGPTSLLGRRGTGGGGRRGTAVEPEVAELRGGEEQEPAGEAGRGRRAGEASRGAGPGPRETPSGRAVPHSGSDPTHEIFVSGPRPVISPSDQAA